MNDTVLSLLVVLALGAGLGWHLGRRPRKTVHLVLAALALPGLPLLLLLLAGVLRSEALGWIAGLSLMVLAVVALPLALGVAAGWVLSRGRRLRLAAQAAARSGLPPADTSHAP